MGAMLVLMILIISVANLVFVVKLWKETKKVRFVKPVSKPVETVSNVGVNMSDLIKQVTSSMEVEAEESGEEEVQLSEEDIQKATAAVLASLKS